MNETPNWKPQNKRLRWTESVLAKMSSFSANLRLLNWKICGTTEKSASGRPLEKLADLRSEICEVSPGLAMACGRNSASERGPWRDRKGEKGGGSELDHLPSFSPNKTSISRTTTYAYAD